MITSTLFEKRYNFLKRVTRPVNGRLIVRDSLVYLNPFKLIEPTLNQNHRRHDIYQRMYGSLLP